jgi:predicted porin
LETGFKPDQNDTTFAARNSAVGLQGAWGSVLIGRWDMPFKTATIAVDPYGDLTASGITGVLNDQTNFDRRDQNIIQYWSPTWAGVNFRLAQQANEGKTATLNPRDTGASISYTSKLLYVFYAYEEHKDVSATVQKEDGNAVGGNINVGPFKIGAQYQEYKKTLRDKQKACMGNIVWTIGNNQLIYQYMNSQDGKLNTASSEPNCKSNSIAYQYNFSRRTFVIASWVKVDNNDAASCNFGSNRLALNANGQDPTAVFAGIRHIF